VAEALEAAPGLARSFATAVVPKLADSLATRRLSPPPALARSQQLLSVARPWLSAWPEPKVAEIVEQPSMPAWLPDAARGAVSRAWSVPADTAGTLEHAAPVASTAVRRATAAPLERVEASVNAAVTEVSSVAIQTTGAGTASAERMRETPVTAAPDVPMPVERLIAGAPVPSLPLPTLERRAVSAGHELERAALARASRAWEPERPALARAAAVAQPQADTAAQTRRVAADVARAAAPAAIPAARPVRGDAVRAAPAVAAPPAPAPGAAPRSSGRIAPPAPAVATPPMARAAAMPPVTRRLVTSRAVAEPAHVVPRAPVVAYVAALQPAPADAPPPPLTPAAAPPTVDAAAAPPPTPPAAAPPPAADAAAAPPEPPSQAATTPSPHDLATLADQLFEHLHARLRCELLIERERAGLLASPDRW
jgi:hypothetical protein